MTAPTTHTVTLRNRFGNSITAPVVHVKELGGGTAEVHVETNYHIEIGYDHPTTYNTPSRTAQGRWMASSREFTPQQTYNYRGEFTRI